MPADDPLNATVITVDPTEALQKALQDRDPESGFLIAVLYQALLRTLDDLLDEFEHEPDRFQEEVAELMNTLTGDEPAPTLN